MPGGLEVYRPHLRYALLDEMQVPDLEESERNVAAALFRLEKSRDVERFRREVGRMAADPDLDPGVRASVYTWLTQVLLPARFPEWSPAEARSLEEAQTMLAERVKEWTREWKQEGLQEGRKEGRKEGLQKGRKEGLQEGQQKGLQEGRQKGLQEGARAFQDFLLSEMAERFGPVPEPIRRRVEETQDLDELKKLGKRLLAAAFLSDLGL